MQKKYALLTYCRVCLDEGTMGTVERLGAKGDVMMYLRLQTAAVSHCHYGEIARLSPFCLVTERKDVVAQISHQGCIVFT